MRRTTVVVMAAACSLGFVACGDDDGGLDEASLADDPTVEQCRTAALTVLGRIEVPDGFDASDGVDEDERAQAEAAVDEASEGLLNPNDDDHPCNERLDELSDEEVEDFLDQVDPAVLELLASLAQPEFTPIEDEL